MGRVLMVLTCAGTRLRQGPNWSISGVNAEALCRKVFLSPLVRLSLGMRQPSMFFYSGEGLSMVSEPQKTQLLLSLGLMPGL
jgi:hypothetical protein